MTCKNSTIKTIRDSVLQAEKQATSLSFPSGERRMRELMAKMLYVTKLSMNDFGKNETDAITPWLMKSSHCSN